MLGVAVNTGAIIVGTILGLLFKKGISDKINSAIMMGVGLCVIFIGVSGMLQDINPIIAVISIVPGGLIGTLIDIDKCLNRLGDRLSAKFSKKAKTTLQKVLFRPRCCFALALWL